MSAFDPRDYFISYNAADRPHAEAINGRLRDAGFTTHFAGTDVTDGGNIPIWMDRALGASTRVLALCSPDYFKPEAVFSEVERAGTFWADPNGASARLVPVEIAPCTYSPLYAPLRRIEIAGMTPDAAAEALLAHLRQTEETRRRDALRKAAATPEIFAVPRARATHFFGRDEALAQLQTTLTEGRNAAVTQAIAGTGGIGKTTLAVEYAHRFGTRGRYAGVWWIPAESESGIVQSLGDLALRLGHPESQDLPAMARWARDKVGQSTEPWLLVFDNLTRPDTLTHRRPSGEQESWLPPGTARVLITSRWDDFTGVAETTRLDQWDLATTAAYLLSVTERADPEGAEALAKVLDGLPLAANQAAAFLRSRPAISFAAYAAEIDRLVMRDRDAGHTGDYPETVYATLTKSLAELPEPTVDLLCLLSWLSPNRL
ncbi:MAG: TIR domain-containing protein [Pseudomonadota bacterium]